MKFLVKLYFRRGRSCYDDRRMERQPAKIKKPTADCEGFSLSAKLKLRYFCLFAVTFCLLHSPVFAATSLQEYAHHVEQAAKLSTDLAAGGFSREEEIESLYRITALLPTTEEIARALLSKDLTHVDNSWLHQAIKNLDATNDDKRYLQLDEIAARLNALHQHLQASLQQKSAAETNASREHLQQILNREEYKPDEKKDSKLQAWIKSIGRKIQDFLLRLFGGKKPPTNIPGGNAISIFQILIVAGLAVLLLWAIITLLKQFRWREAKAKTDTDDGREILGEQFDADTTADDLLKTAAEFARRGEYRMAIRRAYIAALYELEQRGKLTLHQAKTNHDYLRELRSEQQILLPVASMTNSFERVWYGDTTATEEDFSGFIEKYREVAR